MENIKTLWELLQEIANENYYSINDFILYSTEEDRKRIQHELVDKDREQFYKHLNNKEFNNKEELEAEIVKYIEFVEQKSLSIWDFGDIGDIVDDYIKERGLNFNED